MYGSKGNGKRRGGGMVLPHPRHGEHRRGDRLGECVVAGRDTTCDLHVDRLLAATVALDDVVEQRVPAVVVQRSG